MPFNELSSASTARRFATASALAFLAGFALWGCGRTMPDTFQDGAPPSMDGGPADGGRDAGPICVTDSDCDDGVFCDGEETCVAGECVEGPEVVCVDDIDCTIDTCREASRGCEFIPDSSLCPSGEMCDPTLGCGERPCRSDIECSDGIICNGEELCGPEGLCIPGPAPVCDDGIACTVDECSEAVGGCFSRPDDGLCDNGLFCDGAEVCVAGRGCAFGPPVSCDDGNSCTIDACVEATRSCTRTPRDADMDGATSAACSNAGADPSCEGVVVQDGVARGADCDDTRADARPGAEERCDGSDDDCDGFVDEGFETTSFWVDADGDGHGDASAEPLARCVEPDGYADTNDDCDDSNALRRPGAAEACNEVDDDCDERVDEIEGNVFYRDVDGDGFGVAADTVAVASCDAPEGYAPVAGDCRPDDEMAFPGAEERCNRLDDDCSAPSPGGVDEREDRDDDGHAPLDAACFGGFEADDCDDEDPFANPSQSERCNGVDDDCDRDVDEGTDAQCASGVCEAGCHERRGVAVGVSASCLGGASFACWGTMQGVLETPAPAPVTMATVAVRQVAMTGHHACALLVDGTVRPHEPAFDPEPDAYVTWDYCRGYADASLNEATSDYYDGLR